MYLDVKDLSQYLNIKPSTLYAWVAQGKIPHVKINGRIRFQKEEIETWVESFREEKLKAPIVCPRDKSRHEDIDTLVDRVKREVYNTHGGRPDQDRARKEVDDGAV